MYRLPLSPQRVHSKVLPRCCISSPSSMGTRYWPISGYWALERRLRRRQRKWGDFFFPLLPPTLQERFAHHHLVNDKQPIDCKNCHMALDVTSLMMLTMHFDEYLLTLVGEVAAQPVAGQEWQRRLLRPVNEDRRYSQDDAYLPKINRKFWFQ